MMQQHDARFRRRVPALRVFDIDTTPATGSALLLESGDRLLLESGDALLLESSGGGLQEVGYGPGRFRLWIAFGTEAHSTTLSTDAPWVDVTPYCRSADFSTSSRLDRFDRFAAGSGEFILSNTDRLFDPAYAAGTYYGDFKRHVPIRVTGEHDGTRYTVWRGYVRDWRPSYVGRFDSVTTVRATDALGLLARYELDDQTPPIGEGDTAGLRAFRVAGEAGFTALSLTFAGQSGPFAASSFGDNALRHLTRIVTADGGHMYADRDGVLTVSSRVAPSIIDEQNTSQVTLDDTTEPAYESLEIAAVGDGYRDLVRVSGVTGNVQEVDNTATNAAPVVFQRLGTDLADDLAAASAAQFYADLYATESPHPERVTVEIASRTDEERTELLPLRLRHKITVTYSPPGGGADISADCYIDGIEHRVRPGRWVARYQLSPTAPYEALAGFDTWLIVGDATRGQVGTGTVAY